MSDETTVTPPPAAATADNQPTNWGNRILISFVVIILAIGLFLLARQLVPGLWARRVAGLVDNNLTTGTLLGVAIGAVFSFVPVMAIWLGARLMRKRPSVGGWIFWLLFAVALAAPNWLTMLIELTDGPAVQDAKTAMVDAPGYVTGSYVGIAIGLVLAVMMLFLARGRRKAKRQAQELADEYQLLKHRTEQ